MNNLAATLGQGAPINPGHATPLVSPVTSVPTNTPHICPTCGRASRKGQGGRPLLSGSLADRVLVALREADEPLNLAQLVYITGTGVQVVAARLTWMVRAGYLTRHGKTHRYTYTLGPKA
jgi:hypothetical protein